MRDMEEVAQKILRDYGQGRDIDRIDCCEQPNREVIVDLVRKLLRIVYPDRCCREKERLATLVEDVALDLSGQIKVVLHNAGVEHAEEKAQELSLMVLEEIPSVRSAVQTDVQAAYDADPAASSKEEVILCYPGLLAITVYRLANVLHRLQVPLIPRIMTEYAHSVTGIDIHPAAVIGDHFFIDHGTGIVIGETTVIGSHVKIYQGVTLGGLTTSGGQSLRGQKRHPTIEDNVTIYAGASVLGGETIIGRDSVIGSNAFITQSVPPCTTVSMKDAELRYKARFCADCPGAMDP